MFLGLGVNIPVAAVLQGGGGVPVVNNALLLEDGDFLLLEDGDYILLES